MGTVMNSTFDLIHPFQEPQYTEAGPDWSSRLRWLPSPHNDEYPAEENWPEPWRSMRTFPWLTRRTVNEWTFYPEGYDVAMRCNFAGQHKASSRSQNELTHTMLYGRGRQVADKRGGLTEASPGDKSYQVVEYSPGFHKDGSTLPVVNFGGNHSSKPDTFVPLQPLPPIPRETYQSKQDRWRHLEEVQEVQALEIWRPATPLMSSGASHAQANAADHIHSSTSK